MSSRELKAAGSVPGLTIREAGPDDASLVLEYVKKLAAFEGLEDRVSATEGDIRAAMSGCALLRALIAETDSGTAGFVAFRFCFSTFSGKPGLYVEDIFVNEQYRKKGIAHAFFDRLAEIARDEGCIRLEWSVLDWNTRAMEFYRSVGGSPYLGWQIWRRELSGE